MTIKQFRSSDGTGTLSYFIIDDATGKAILIDPNVEDAERLAEFVAISGIHLMAIIDTHTHADHISGAGKLKGLTGAPVLMHELSQEKYKYVDQGDAFGIGDILRENVKIKADRYLRNGDTISIGDLRINVIYTPGHTNDHIALLARGHLFTGDVLLIGQAGRSDLPSGNTDEQYETIFGKIMTMPDDTVIHPGHDYEGHDSSTLAVEKATNPFLERRSKEEYHDFVDEFFPPLADISEGHTVMQCGVRRIESDHEGYRNIQPSELKKMMSEIPDIVLIDVREPEELTGLGAIEGVVNIPVGQLIYGRSNVERFKDKRIVVLCQTGSRSAEAAHFLVSKGFRNVYNLTSGTLGWMLAGGAVTRPKRKGIFA